MKELEKTRQESSRIFVLILLALYLGNALMAVFITPLTHIGTPELMPIHLGLAVVGSALLVLGPILLLWYRPLSVFARHAAAVVMGLECSIATALSGGQIELHFTFFIATVFLAFALDPAILWTFVGVVFIDHAVRGWIFPDSVYGCSMWRSEYGSRPPLWLAAEHAGFVALQLVALLWFIKKRTIELLNISSISDQFSGLRSVKTSQVAKQINEDLVAATVAAEKVADEAKIALEKVAAAMAAARGGE